MPGKFVKLDYETIDSQRWINLTAQSKELFIQIKRHRYVRTGKRTVINHSDQAIKFKYSDLPDTNRKTETGGTPKIISKSQFYKCIKELIFAGFIEIIQQGDFKTKTPSVYAISENWKDPYFNTEQTKHDNPPF